MNKYIAMAGLGLAAALVVAACSTAMQVDGSLQQNADTYAVKGRQGFILNQKLSFGEYRSGRVKRGWTRSYDIPFVVRFQGAKEKLSFNLNDQDNPALKSEVFCVGKITAQELSLFNRGGGIPLKNEDVFTAAIHLPEGGDTWELVLNNPNKRLWGVVSEGTIQHGDETIRIEEVRHTDRGHENITTMLLGYHFVWNGRTVGAVETMNQGRVVLSKDLTPTQRFVLANAAAAILLRSEIDEQIDG